MFMPNYYYLLYCIICSVFSSHYAVGALSPLPPKIQSPSYLLLDMHSGQVLASQQPDRPIPPASLTKIMTAYVVFQSLQQGTLQLDDPVKISKKAWRTPGSRMFIEVNSQVSVDDLLHGLVVQSGNDAAVALAEHIAGNEANFAQLMNTQAAQLGMHNTHFTNATGLPEEQHYSTATDLARVSMATIQEYPEYYRLYAKKTFTYNNIKQNNRNNLLWRDRSVDGVKTGHTQAAGYCLIAAAERDGMRLISVILGANDKAQRLSESQALLNHGYRFYRTHRLYTASAEIIQPRIWYGTEQQLSAGLAEDLYVTIPRGQYQQLNTQVKLNPNLQAPIAKGQTLGTLVVTLGEHTIQQVPVVALQALPVGSLWRQAVDHTLQFLE